MGSYILSAFCMNGGVIVLFYIRFRYICSSYDIWKVRISKFKLNLENLSYIYMIEM